MRRRDAFTVTELLVFIPIGTSLAVLLLASLGGAKQTVAAAACLNNMRQWGLGLTMYANDWNDCWPYEGEVAPLNSIGISGAPGNTNAWFNVVPPYLGQKGLADLYLAGKAPTSQSGNIWACPSATNTVNSASLTVAAGYFMYAFNARMDPNNTAGNDLRFKRSQLVAPASTIIFSEAPEAANPSTTGAHAPARHFGGGHFAMGDGHAEWVAYTNFCRSCPAMPCSDNNSFLSCDWKTGVKYHWFPYPDAPT